MTLANNLNIAGVICTTIGSFVVWYFIAEVSSDNRKEIAKGGEVRFKIPHATAELRARIRREIFLSRLGIALIALGGALQIAAALQ